MNKNMIQIKELFDFFYLNESSLTVTQVSFIESCKRQFRKNKELSEKQVKVLSDMKKYSVEKPQRVTMKI